MAQFKKILALILTICVVCSVGILSVGAATAEEDNEVAASSITVHYYCEDGTPSIYYWNSLPQNISKTIQVQK